MPYRTPKLVLAELLFIGAMLMLCSLGYIWCWNAGWPFDGGSLGAPDKTPLWLKYVSIILPALLGSFMIVESSRELIRHKSARDFSRP
jgi:TRAP-type C4-dicarboxylate transport system permease small subunit